MKLSATRLTAAVNSSSEQSNNQQQEETNYFSDISVN